MKRCPRCGLTKPVDEFSKDAKRKDGRQTYCKSCYQERYLETRDHHVDMVTQRRNQVKADNRITLMKYLHQHPCVDCGEVDPVVLEFDHLRDKKESISKLLNGGYYWKVIEEEIAKCEVVCANCHRRRTNKRSSSWRTHAPLG